MGSDQQDNNAAPTADTADAGSSPDRSKQYADLIETLPHPVFVIDHRGYLTFANQTFTTQFGYELTPDTELHVSDLLADDDVDMVIEALRTITTGSPADPDRHTLELDAVSQTGRTRTFDATLTPIVTDGAFDGAAALLRDITLRKRRDDIFTVMDRALRHNLRTNVNLITGYVDHLRQEIDEHAVHFTCPEDEFQKAPCPFGVAVQLAITHL